MYVCVSLLMFRCMRNMPVYLSIKSTPLRPLQRARGSPHSLVLCRRRTLGESEMPWGATVDKDGLGAVGVSQMDDGVGSVPRAVQRETWSLGKG